MKKEYTFYQEATSLNFAQSPVPQNIQEKLSFTESKNSNGQLRIVLPVTVLDVVNENKRLYPTALLQKICEDVGMKQFMKSGKMLGAGDDHPDPPSVKPIFASHMITDAWVEQIGNAKYLMNEWVTLLTDNGKNLVRLLESGAVPGVSIRGFGLSDGNGDPKKQNEGTMIEYYYAGTDVVGNPSANLYVELNSPHVQFVECVTGGESSNIPKPSKLTIPTSSMYRHESHVEKSHVESDGEKQQTLTSRYSYVLEGYATKKILKANATELVKTLGGVLEHSSCKKHGGGVYSGKYAYRIMLDTPNTLTPATLKENINPNNFPEIISIKVENDTFYDDIQSKKTENVEGHEHIFIDNELEQQTSLDGDDDDLHSHNIQEGAQFTDIGGIKNPHIHKVGIGESKEESCLPSLVKGEMIVVDESISPEQLSEILK